MPNIPNPEEESEEEKIKEIPQTNDRWTQLFNDTIEKYSRIENKPSRMHTTVVCILAVGGTLFLNASKADNQIIFVFLLFLGFALALSAAQKHE